MKRSLAWTALAGIVGSVMGLGAVALNPAFGTELDGFAINTQDKAVTVTLFTDERVQYTTEHQGRQFAIILPDAKLSEAQINNGLPVVIDNKNRFIGRAVPTADGKVKIILPNLPASEYAISVQQRRPGQVAATAPLAKPHDAVSGSGQFEQIAARFPKPMVKPAVDKSVMRLNSAPSIANKPVAQSIERNMATSEPAAVSMQAYAPVEGNAEQSNGGSRGPIIVNPFVVKSQSSAYARSPYSRYRPVYQARPRYVAPPINDEPVTTISMADSMANANRNPFQPTGEFAQGALASAPADVFPGLSSANANLFGNQSGPRPKPKDPLWFLHSLPPANPSALPFDSLKGLAKDLPIVGGEADETPDAQPTVVNVQTRNAFADLKDAALGLPKWLLITVAVFLGGMGSFMLVGGLVLLRILFSQARHGGFTGLAHGGIVYPGLPYIPVDTQGQPLMTPMMPNVPETAKSPYATAPGARQQISFEDKAAVNALDYLGDGSGNIARAVQNTVLVKFPAHRNRKVGARRTGVVSAR